MYYAFFKLAVTSPRKQAALRWITAAHLGLFVPCLWWACYRASLAGIFMSYLLLTAGIVEGAILLGWRLTQLPKSQALEFLLVSPIRPWRLFLAEMLCGLGRLALVTLSGLPLLLLFAASGFFTLADLAPLMLMPFTWGALTGVGLACWAYESQAVRRWGERFLVVLVVVYLIVGVLAGEQLSKWIDTVPRPLGLLRLNSLEAFNRYNPFAVVRFWMTDDFAAARERFWGVEQGAILLLAAFVGRSAIRLSGHFHDLHYRPILESQARKRGSPGDDPLTWWAVRRVSQYSGRVNLWLAGGFGLLYALYTVAGPSWPGWLGRSVFAVFDHAGGVPVWAAALVVLASVPAAFQYGLWDSNTQDRCRRLELLLLTRLEGAHYWRASLAAAWRRGRGYFAIAAVLWGAAFWAGSLSFTQSLAGMTAAVILWSFYFTLGFRCFSRGTDGGRTGILLTVGLPLLTFVLLQFGWKQLAALVPPGNVYYGASFPGTLSWTAGALLTAVLCLIVGRRSQATCDAELRRWYDLHHVQNFAD